MGTYGLVESIIARVAQVEDRVWVATTIILFNAL